MRYVRLAVTNDGGSEFVDAVLDDEVRTVAAGLPPLRVAGPFEATQVMFVLQSGKATDWHHHVASRRQWIVFQTGMASCWWWVGRHHVQRGAARVWSW
jgi:hypothetical protein